MAANSRYPTDEFAKRHAQQTDRRLKMLEEAMTRTPKKEPVAPPSGGFVGVAEVFSQTGTITAGTSSMAHNNVRYDAPTDPFDADTPLDWLDFEASNLSRITLEVGYWYWPVVEFHIPWVTAAHSPSFFKPVIYFGGRGHDWDKQWIPATTDNSSVKGLYHFANIGPIYATDEFTVLQAQCSWTTAGGTSLDFPRIVWKISKLT